MEAAEAALRVLEEDPGSELHWTVIWDRALRAGYVNPLEDPDARARFMRALGELAAGGRIERTAKGTYSFPALGNLGNPG